MVICKDLDHIQHFNESVLTIGSLDGMHKGHAEIFSTLKDLSKSNNKPLVVITFDPHPKTVLGNSRKPTQTLISVDKKMYLLEKYSVEYLWIIPFDKDFSTLSASSFLKNYISKYFNPVDIVIGYDHHFGFNREGNANFLERNKRYFGYNLHIKDPILYDDLAISSSRIRSYLNSGKIDKANDCLGWEYEFSGTVVKGEGKGTELEFPTANIQPDISSQLIPACGVYCVDAIIDNCYYTGMCNIGKRPTFYKNGKEVIEVHLFSEQKLNIYDKNIKIIFKKYLRAEKKYNSSNELTKQLKLDRQTCFTL